MRTVEAGLCSRAVLMTLFIRPTREGKHVTIKCHRSYGVVIDIRNEYPPRTKWCKTDGFIEAGIGAIGKSCLTISGNDPNFSCLQKRRKTKHHQRREATNTGIENNTGTDIANHETSHVFTH